MTVSVGLPDANIFSWTRVGTMPAAPFADQALNEVFAKSMKVSTPFTIAVVYFSFVHFINPYIRQRQVNLYNKSAKTPVASYDQLSKAERRALRPAPFAIAHYGAFKLFVLLHNVALCLYSAWTLFGMVYTLRQTVEYVRPLTGSDSLFDNFFTAVCDTANGVFNAELPWTNLTVYGWWFYVSKFYEVLDTVIILLKGKPSSLLQSYHHAGAMMCMWAGIRFQSPPIWIFVVFNSFIHSLMYFYFSLSCLKVRVPTICKRILTSMQISQFVIGGSLAVFHAFVWFTKGGASDSCNCISTSDQALPLFINVAYLTPLTALFGLFYIESYIKKKRA